MRALSDALPTGHRAMANPTLQLHFGCGRATPQGKPLPQLAIREDANFFVQNWTKKLFFANKDPKNNFDDWMILQKHVLSFKCNDFFKMANLKAISSSATLIAFLPPCGCLNNGNPASLQRRHVGGIGSNVTCQSLLVLFNWLFRHQIEHQRSYHWPSVADASPHIVRRSVRHRGPIRRSLWYKYGKNSYGSSSSWVEGPHGGSRCLVNRDQGVRCWKDNC